MKPIKTAREIYLKHGCAFVVGTEDNHFIEAMHEYHNQFDVTDEEIEEYLSKSSIIIPEHESKFGIYEIGFKDAIWWMREQLKQK